VGNRVEGKVAFITGAARGQGRSHAVRLAEEGANIIAVDICAQIESNPYPLATPEDLAETERLVKEAGGQIVTRIADVRDRAQLAEALAEGLQEFGKLDVVVANAGIMPISSTPKLMDFVDGVDVDLVGVLNTVAIAVPHLKEFGSIVITGSTAGMISGAMDNPALGAGGLGYQWSKKTLIDYTEKLALLASPYSIRVNCVHPTNVNTHLVHNEVIYKTFRPDLENPTREDAELAFTFFQGMPIPYVEPVDISNLVLFLASDESRYMTGQNIRVDAASLLKFAGGMPKA
jgi:SDR family mycofactocin-dependent oxidoreductase